MPKPSRYAGCEEGAVFKDARNVKVRLGLAFPDLYEVGMSYLGQKILYSIVNEREDWWAERVFAPCREAGRVLKERGRPLCTLESDTPLADLDLVGFSVTHELCYTNILYMLDLAGIPFRASDREKGAGSGRRWPLIVAGGGCALSAEPIAPFMDLMLLGEGEESLPELAALIERGKREGWDRRELVLAASGISGVYVPEFFDPPTRSASGAAGTSGLCPGDADAGGAAGAARVIRRVTNDLDSLPYPEKQPIPFGAVHNRLALEIARGCTRGCRFCHAGIIYRPVRERSVDNLQKLLNDCLSGTGFDDVSFLSLSTGDFSALKGLFMSTVDRCAREQVSVSLPSLRVGSIDDSIMERMAGIRRTGATLAPEAGSQRLRDIINKGITEEEFILHIQKLFEYGWRQVKLYFMIGLPGETEEDLSAIVDLCRKARDAAGPGIKSLQITAAVSPFVPKPHTPFQWAPQISMAETRRRVGLLLDAVRKEKRITLRWHDPEMTTLEGIFSRGDRRLADVLEKAYAKGAVFASWADGFKLAPWLEAMSECGLAVDEFTGEIPVDAPLPWDHLETGISRAHLLREMEKARRGALTPDCRYSACQGCGVCDTQAGPSGLKPMAYCQDGPRAESCAESGAGAADAGYVYENRLNLPERDQQANRPNIDQYGRVITKDWAEGKTGGKAAPPAIAAQLVHKAAHLLVRYARRDRAVYLSQLEIQAVFERAMRRAGLPLSFSQGYHPLPLLSFGRALPVGVGSECEWFTVMLREERDPDAVLEAMNKGLPRGLEIVGVESVPVKDKIRDLAEEAFVIRPLSGAASPAASTAFFAAWERIGALESLPWERETKKGLRMIEARPYFKKIDADGGQVGLVLDWSAGYVSPLALCRQAMSAVGLDVCLTEFVLVKVK